MVRSSQRRYGLFLYVRLCWKKLTHISHTSDDEGFRKHAVSLLCPLLLPLLRQVDWKVSSCFSRLRDRTVQSWAAKERSHSAIGTKSWLLPLPETATEGLSNRSHGWDLGSFRGSSEHQRLVMVMTERFDFHDIYTAEENAIIHLLALISNTVVFPPIAETFFFFFFSKSASPVAASQ